MDYSVKDSSIIYNPNYYQAYYRKDDSLRVGCVREVKQTPDGTVLYVVECSIGGNQVPINCLLMSRWGGAHNYEEYRLRSWANKVPDPSKIPSTESSYKYRSGDVVIVGFLNGKGREGIILGGIRHAARDFKLQENVEYLSIFNGLEKKVDAKGAYTVTFKGKAINDEKLDIPGEKVPEPEYNEEIAGSFFGFDETGGFTIDDNQSSSIKIVKNADSPSLTITSGQNVITLSGSSDEGTTTVETTTLSFTSTSATFESAEVFSVDAGDLKLKGSTVALGNDSFELIEGLIELLDGIGSLVITSPVGTCTPVMAAPQWASKIIPIKTKLETLKGSL